MPPDRERVSIGFTRLVTTLRVGVGRYRYPRLLYTLPLKAVLRGAPKDVRRHPHLVSTRHTGYVRYFGLSPMDPWNPAPRAVVTPSPFHVGFVLRWRSCQGGLIRSHPPTRLPAAGHPPDSTADQPVTKVGCTSGLRWSYLLPRRGSWPDRLLRDQQPMASKKDAILSCRVSGSAPRNARTQLR